MRDRSVIYISHRFTEIAEICDRATVLRDGETVGDVDIEPGIEERIVEMMLGGACRARPGPAMARRASAARPRRRACGCAA